MTILVAVKKNNQVFVGADRITTFGSEYATDLVDNCKMMKLRNGYLATSGYTLIKNIIEHLSVHDNELINSRFESKTDVFQFFLKLYTELKDNYTLVDAGKDTYAGIYNSFILVTPKSIFGVANNLSVHEYDRYVARGAGSDYSLGSLYSLYDILDDGQELTRLALEAACQYSLYCKEPLDIIEVKESTLSKKRSALFKPSKSEITTLTSKAGMSKYTLTKKRRSSRKTRARSSKK